jgi:hypothetical protein
VPALDLLGDRSQQFWAQQRILVRVNDDSTFSFWKARRLLMAEDEVDFATAKLLQADGFLSP